MNLYQTEDGDSYPEYGVNVYQYSGVDVYQENYSYVLRVRVYMYQYSSINMY